MKKFFALFALLVFSTAAFAGNSPSSVLLDESLSYAASSLDDEGVDSQTVLNTQKALTIGKLTFEAHRDLNSMTEDDKAIEKALESQIPAILNKIQKTSDEVYQELEPALGKLTDLLLKNQTVYPASSVDRETGVYLTMFLDILHAEEKGLFIE